MNTHQNNWTDARVAKLVELHGLGLSAGQIAENLGGITRNAVIGKVNRLKLGPLGGTPVKTPMSNMRAAKTHSYRGNPAWTPDMKAYAIAEWKKGTPVAHIAAALGKTKGQLSQYAGMHRELFPSRIQRGRPSVNAPLKRNAEPSFIAPQFLVPPEGYDAERLEVGKTLENRGMQECAWPLGNGGPFIFCCAETVPGKSYCSHHYGRMHGRQMAEAVE